MQQNQNLKEKTKRYEYFDWLVLIAVLILASLGILMVFSITGTSIHNNRSGDRLSYMIHSTTGVILGVIAMTVMSLLPNRIFKDKILGGIVFLFTTLLFILTVIFGEGTELSPDVRRWLVLPGGFRFQAVDLLRIGFTLSLPWLIQFIIDKKKYSKGFVIAFLYVIFATAMVVLQRDLGSAIIMLTTGVFIFLSSGLQWKYLLLFMSIAAMSAIVLWVGGVELIALLPYQEQRINIWIDPFVHPHGHQIVMGYVSIALGGWTGVGIGRSTQALGFAIEPHTDLIVTILSEELGLIAVFVIMILYLFIATKCFITAFKARDTFSALVCIGIGTFFLAQPFVNLGGVSGVIPLSGVTLPLISYGMTSKLSTFILIGLYFNMRRKILKDYEQSNSKKPDEFNKPEELTEEVSNLIHLKHVY